MVDRILDPQDLERAQQKALVRYQHDRLRRLLRWARRTPFYKRHFGKIWTEDAVKDLSRLPLTSKEDLLRSIGQGRFPLNCWCPVDNLAFIGQTGGPGTEDLAQIGSRPLPIPMRHIDLARRAFVAMRAFRMVSDKALGPTALLQEVSSSIVHQAMLRGLARSGARPMALGRGSTLRHVRETLGKLRLDNLVTHPTYATFLKTLEQDTGTDLKFKRLFLWGEVGASVGPVRKRLSKAFDAKVHDIYAMQELGVLAAECKAGKGLHGFEDQFVYEIVDPKTGQVQDDGKEGELVVTDLHRCAFPLIRYRTGDITSIEHGKCKCGRTHLRLAGIKGRVSEAVSGTDGARAYPADILAMLEKNPHLTGVFRIVPGEGTFVETKENKQMAKYYLEKSGQPPGKVTFERVLPRFLHRTEYVVNARYELRLKEQIGRER
jgi:phenylacetate-CoA ligase